MQELNLNNEPRAKIKLKPKHIELNWIWNIIMLIVCAGFITAVTFYIQPGSMLKVLQLITQQPLILVVNLLPPIIVISLIYFICNNVFYSAAITGVIFNLLSLINRLKIIMRDDPLVPRDVQLISEALNTVSSFEVDIDIPMIMLIILVMVGCIILGKFITSKKMSKKIRGLGVVICIVVAVLANKFIYSSADVYYHKLHVSTRSYVTRVYTELGFTYCFLYNLNTYPVEKPDDYSKATVEGWIKDYTTTDATEPSVKPHVVMIMSEAFSDISNDKAFHYTEENDPLKYFKQIAASDQAISGHIVVSGFGGGTANTEFDVLTGMQTNLLNSVATSAFRVVGKNINTIPRFFMRHGYQSFYMHPGESWFYNRSSVYKYFGIDNQVFSEAFTKADYKGNMVSDKVLTEKFIKKFEELTQGEDSKPLFTYVTTIQNHMAYTNKKYGDLPIQPAPVSDSVSQEGKDYLSVYMEGVKDADQMLKDLTDYFDSIDEPVVLAFFGDHLPNLGDDYLAYKAAGIDVGNTSTVQEVIKTYSTPYIIWTNKAAAKDINLQEMKETLQIPKDGTISDNFLGAMMTEMLGYKGNDPYYDFLNELRRKMPVIWKEYYETIDKGYTQDITDEEKALVDKLHNWQYYKLKNEKLEK